MWRKAFPTIWLGGFLVTDIRRRVIRSAKERQRDNNRHRKETTTASAPDVETVQLDLL